MYLQVTSRGAKSWVLRYERAGRERMLGLGPLRDFSLKVKQGETIALVGPTGAGKSTIVNLICRFYEPKSGVIRM